MEMSKDRVKAAARKAGSVRKLAGIAGISDATIYQYMKDPTKVTPETTAKLEKAVKSTEKKNGRAVVPSVPATPVVESPVSRVERPDMKAVVEEQIRREYSQPTDVELALRLALSLAEKDRELNMYRELEKFR